MYGGPVYFYQNLVYNAPASGSLKLIATPAGVLVYQNTFVGGINARGPASNVHFRNNLILSQEEADPVFAVGTYTSYSTSDYNAFRQNPGKDDAFEWNLPAAGLVSDYKSPPVVHRYKTLKEYSDASGQEKHSVLVDYDTFMNVSMPDKTGPAASLQARRFGLPAEAGFGRDSTPELNCRRSPTDSPERRRTSARTKRAGPCRSTGRATKPCHER